MEIKQGIPVSQGVAIGEAFVLDSEDYRIPQRFIGKKPEDIAREKQRYLDALVKGANELKEIEKATAHMRDISIIFQGHRFILEDPGTKEEVLENIEKNFHNAEYAVSQIIGNHRQKLKSLPQEYYTKRVSDLEDIENRILRHLLGTGRESLHSLKNPVVIVARDLTPSQTAILPLEKVLGVATDTGGRTSHTAIVARTRGIPAVVGLGNGTSQICGGDYVIVDGSNGVIIIRPDKATLAKYKQIQKEQNIRNKKLKLLKKLPAETVDGYPVTLRSNIESPSEIKIALENGSSGIGLYRTEFIYVDNPSPTEEHHFEIYKRALEQLKNNKLVIRTLDFGADKNFVGSGIFEEEPNPFLGCRSIRFCFENTDTFKTQLRAILRASVYGNADIMFPMISSLDEIKLAKKFLDEAKSDLDQQNIPYKRDIAVGIMIEIPSAAIISDLLANEVDFFSIGTNDLIQYTLAVDRSNERVAHLYKPAHPAVFRLIQKVIEVGKTHGINVRMCGEMSGELLYVVPLLGMGLREFSLSPGLIPEVKDLIRSITMRQAKKIVRELFNCQTHDQSINYLISQVPFLRD